MEEKEEFHLSKGFTEDKEQHEPSNQPGAAGDAEAAALSFLPLPNLEGHLGLGLSLGLGLGPDKVLLLPLSHL